MIKDLPERVLTKCQTFPSSTAGGLKEIIPLYHETDEQGVPRGWVRMIKEAMKTAVLNFNARRMVKEYMEKFYKPAMRTSAAGREYG